MHFFGFLWKCFPTNLHVHTVPAFVLTLHHLWDKCVAACGATNALKLRDGLGTPGSGELTFVKGQHLDIPQ